MVKIKGRIFKSGNSYALRISKHWIDSGIIPESGNVELDITYDQLESLGQDSGKRICFSDQTTLLPIIAQ